MDLELEQKKEILFLYYQREKISHFLLLGVSPDASAEEVRKAWLARSRDFHPDRFFRKRLGSYQEKMEDIFHRLRLASEVLLDPASRRRYEVDAAHLFTPEERSALVSKELAAIEAEKRAAQRQRMMLRSKGFARLTRARELIAEGDKLKGEGDLAGAMERFEHAAELDPRLELARARIAESRRDRGSLRIEKAMERAALEQKEGRFEQAESILRTAITMDESNPRPRLMLAKVLLQSGKNLRDARIHVQRAIGLGAQGGLGHRLHGEILLALGQKREARSELHLAASKGDSEAKKMLESL